MKNNFGLKKYFSDVESKKVRKYLDYLISKIGIAKVLDLTNGILNTELSVKHLKKGNK